MRLKHWFFLILFMVTVGCLRIAAHNAVVFKSYTLGDHLRKVHTLNTDLGWLNAEVLNLNSPVHLAQIAKEHKMKPIIRVDAPNHLIHGPIRFASSAYETLREPRP